MQTTIVLVNQHDNNCPKCGSSINDGGKTCGSCGSVSPTLFFSLSATRKVTY